MQDLSEKLQIMWHAFTKRHHVHEGIQNGTKIFYCQCGFMKPRVNLRDNEPNPFSGKMLTDPEAQKIIKGMREQ